MTSTETNELPAIDSFGQDRRTFLRAGTASLAGLMCGAFATVSRGSTMASPSGTTSVVEASISQLQAMMASGAASSRQITLSYLQRIVELNPLLHAVIETNPEAVAIAARLDNERRAGRVRGPLHGIPILLKDNIATADEMETTAGSLALVGSRVPADAAVVNRLRRAGAVILGKANLSEWANFRGFVAPTFNGWSARGGFTRNPYVLEFDTSGSSSGPAVAAAASLCSAAVGTETDGSIVTPSGNNLVVGLKPSVGLLSQQGIIPIGHSQDTAGPIGRTVADVAILLGALQSPVGPAASVAPRDYTSILKRGALKGARIGIDQRYFAPEMFLDPTLGPDIAATVTDIAIPALESLGATAVPTDTGDPFLYFDAEFTVLLTEFKVQIAEYLASLHNTKMRSLADLIAFNIEHCPQEMKYYGQELFEISEATGGDLTDPSYIAARQLCLELTQGANGIDGAIARDKLDAIIAPSYTFASSPSAVPGYPSLSLPIGQLADGKPVGIWMYSGFLTESRLLALAYDLEQELHAHRAPEFRGSVPPPAPDAGICAALPVQKKSGAREGRSDRWHRPVM